MELLTIIIIGLIAGWVGSMLMKGRGLGIIGDIMEGIIGALIGGYLLAQLGVNTGGFIGSVVTAIIGSVILLFLISLVQRSEV